MKSILTKIFQKAMWLVFQQQSQIQNSDSMFDPMIQAASRPEYGDYQANFAMKFARQFPTKQDPADIAGAVITALDKAINFLVKEKELIFPEDNWVADFGEINIGKREESDDVFFNKVFKTVFRSGPGFINISLANKFLEQQLQSITNDNNLGVAKIKKPETVVVDYGGANVAKEMHVGHLRSAIIGDAIVRILKYLGCDVKGQNHLGDWGTQFGMLIEYMIESGEENKQHNLSDLNALYKNSKKRFDEDEAFANKARARVVALQSGDKPTLAIWQRLVDESKQQFQIIYDRLDLLLNEEDARGESFYKDELPKVVNEFEENDVSEVSAGAKVIFMTGFLDPDKKPLPLIIEKKDGGYLYATTDLAAIKYRIQTLHSTRLIYVVDARQKQHFAMVFAAAEKAGWAKNIKLEHLYYGAILGDDHKPFKTRSGEAVKLSDLLDEAESRATEVASKKNADLSKEQIKNIAHVIGVGALKYADLRADKIKDYVFSWDKMLSFDGNTAPYLQNAYVRIQAIFRKGNIDNNKLIELRANSPIKITEEIEHVLAIKLLEFPEIIYSVADDLSLHRLCDYLYDVASTFHKFYEHCPILIPANSPLPLGEGARRAGEGLRDSRLLICDLTARTLKQGLNLLGINVLEMM